MTLELLGLSKAYPDTAMAAVRDLTLRVDEGSLTALLGPSGAGKSTVMKMIAGLLAPDSGDIRLGGRSILPLPPERRDVVMVVQNALLFPHLTLAENIGFGLRMRGRPGREIAVRVAELLEKVQLSGLGHRRPHELSGGQQGRGALARALILEPKVLLLDEPLSNLDANLRDDMRALIRSLQRETGITTLVVTHDQTEAVIMSDRIALLLDGRLAQDATPQDIFRKPASRAVARFFGGVNFIPGHVKDGQFKAATGPFAVPLAVPDGPGTLTIRPEAVRLGTSSADRLATVTETAFLGTQCRVVLDLDGQRIEALAAPSAAAGLQPGASVRIEFPEDDLWLLPELPG